MTMYCVYCYKIMDWDTKQRKNWYNWKLASSCHARCMGIKT